MEAFRQTEKTSLLSLGQEVVGMKGVFRGKPLLKDGALWRYQGECGLWAIWRVWGKGEKEDQGQELAYRQLDWFSVRGRNGGLRSARRLHRELVLSGEAETRFLRDQRGKLWLYLATMAEGRPQLVCRPYAFLQRHQASLVHSVLTDGEGFLLLPGNPPGDGTFLGKRHPSCPPLPPDLDPAVVYGLEERTLWWELLVLHRDWLRRNRERPQKDKV